MNADILDPHRNDKADFLRRADQYLYVQLEPIVDVREGRLVACESLVRGTRDMGAQTPSQLLDQAAGHQALVELELMLAEKSLNVLENATEIRPRLFLNIDGRTLPHWKIYRDRMLFLLGERNIAPPEVTIEVSEAKQVIVGKAFETAIEGLRNAGFLIALDDFGTGFSGLRMLYETRPNFLKADRFFIQAMPSDAHKRLLVQAIARLANTLGAQVIAEGVETAEEFLACRNADCDFVQGYLLKAPTDPPHLLHPEYALPEGESKQHKLDEKLSSLLQRIKPVQTDVKLRELHDRYTEDSTLEVIPVVNTSMVLLGGILTRDLRPIFGSQYGTALANNSAYHFPTKDLVTRLPTIDVRQPLSDAIDLIADRARDGVFVLDGATYVGYLSPFDLMQLANGIRLAQASSRNPLSGLPGNEAIAEVVTEFSKAIGKRRLCGYIDISDFKPFNDKFGFDSGDRAILLLSDELKRVSDLSGAFVGHIGGDDFFISAVDDEIDAVLPVLKSLPTRFYDMATALVPAHFQTAGFYDGTTRSGEAAKIPLISCTTVYCEFEKGVQSPPPGEMAGKLAELKSEARKNGKQSLHRRTSS